MANIIQVRAIESITQLQASLDEHGADYVGGSASKVVKFELWLDASQLSQFDANATEIYDFSFNIGWNASDLQALAWGVTGDQLALDDSFVSYNYNNANNMAITFNPDNSGVASIAFSSPNSVVDTLTPLFGADAKGPELLIATFYANPVDQTADSVSLTITNINVGTNLTDSFDLDDVVVGAIDATDTSNTAPVAVGTMSDVTIELGESATLNPDDYFTDADGDPLTYTVTIDGVFTQPWSDFAEGPSDPGSIGNKAIVVTADDGKGGTATQSFNATIIAATDGTNAVEDYVYDSFVAYYDDGSVNVSKSARIDDSSTFIDILEGYGLTLTNLVAFTEPNEEHSIDRQTITIDSVSYDGAVLATNVSMKVYIDFSTFEDTDNTNNQPTVAYSTGVESLTDYISSTAEQFTGLILGNYGADAGDETDAGETETDAAGIVHTETVTEVDNILTVNETTTLGFDLTYTVNTTTGNSTITGTYVASDGTKFTDVSAQATFNPAGDNGDGNLENATGTAIASTGESATFVSNSTNNGFVITYTDSNNAVRVLTATDDAVMVSNTTTAEATTNTAPVTVGTMSDITMTDGDNQSDYQIDPANYFSDADSDTLTYTVTTSNLDGTEPNTETLDEWNNSTWVIGQDGSEAGQTMLFVITADDGKGGAATQTFTATISAAQVTNTAPAIQIIEENDVIYIVANDANGSQVLKQEVDTKTGYSVDAVELQDNGTGGSYTDSVTGITWTQTWDSNTNTTTTTNDATDYSRTEIGDNNGTEIITSTTGENYVVTNDTANDTQNIKGLIQVGAAIFDIDFTFSTTDYSTISATWSATTDYVTPTNNLPSWTDEAGVVHTETVTEVDNILTVKETTTLGFDLTYTVNTTTGDSTITGTYVASDGTKFTDVSAQATFNPAGDNGDGNLENATGTAIASTGESATFVSNSTNNGFVITYTDSNNAVRVLTATDDAVMVSNTTTAEAPADTIFDPSTLNLDLLSKADWSTDLIASFASNGLTATGLSAIGFADEARGIDENTVTIASVSFGETVLASNVSMKIYIDFSAIVTDNNDNYVSGEATVAYSTGVETLTDYIPLTAEQFTGLIVASYAEDEGVTNTAPVVNNTIADVVVTEGENYPTFDPDALGWFSDADGDQLTYTFHWPEDAIDDVENLAEFNNLNATEIMPVGEEVVTVIATDPSGDSVTQTMKFIVNANTNTGSQDDLTAYDSDMQAYVHEQVSAFLDRSGITDFQTNLDVTMSYDNSGSDVISIKVSNLGLDLTLVFDEHGAITNNPSLPLGMTIADIEAWYEYSDPEKSDEYVMMAVEELLEQVGIYDYDYPSLSVDMQAQNNSDILNIVVDSIDVYGTTVYAVNMSFTFTNGLVTNKSGVPFELNDVLGNIQLETWYEYSGPDKQKEHDQQDGGYFDDDDGYVEEYSYVYTWEDWEGITWTVVDKDVGGVWTSTSTSSAGDVRINTSSWKDSTGESTWSEQFTNAEGTIDFVRTETSIWEGDNAGTTIVTTGTNDHVGWQYLGAIYTDINVTETLDAYWNTTSLTGTAKNSDGTVVNITYNADNYEVLIDGKSVYDDYSFDDYFSTTNEYEWTDWDGTLWKVSEQDENGTWTTTETAYDETGTTATGDVRIYTSSWDDTTQTSVWSEAVTSQAQGLNFTRVETSVWNGINDGTTITTTGDSDYVGWQYLGEIYTGLNVTETMDANWNTLSITGSGTNQAGTTVTFSWDASNWQILADDAVINAGYDDQYANIEEQKDWEYNWEWTDWDGTVWQVVDKEVGGLWTSTETAYDAAGIATGDVRVNSSSWDDSTSTSTWIQNVVSVTKGLDYTIVEVYKGDGTSETITTGSTETIGWMPLNEVYTEVSVVETRDANWTTVSITGTGKDTDGVVVNFGYDANTYQITLDGVAFDPWANSYTDDYGVPTDPVPAIYENTYSWDDWDGSTWTVVDKEENGVWVTTETNSVSGDIRTYTSSWDDSTNTSLWSESFTAGDESLDYTRSETYNSDGSSSTTTTGKSEYISWEYLGEVYTNMDVTETRDANWNTVSVIGSGTNADGDVVEFGYNDGQITFDGDTFGKHDEVKYSYEWEYTDYDGVEWTVTDSQDGDWWKSVEISEHGDKRVNKSMWNELGDDDNEDGVIDSADNGAYSKYVSKFKSADESINYKLVEKYYDNYQGTNDSRSVMVVKGDSDYLGWDYLGEIYTDIDYKVIRDSNWEVLDITSAKNPANSATAKNANGAEVTIEAGQYGEILIDGKDIYELNDDFFDFGDEFDMGDGWVYEYQDHNGHTISVEEKDVYDSVTGDSTWTTIEKNIDTDEVSVRTYEYDTTTQKDIETENQYTSQENYAAGVVDHWTIKSYEFVDNADGGYSMKQSITSKIGEDFVRTETYNEDGTTTITTVGTVWFDGMLVQNAEITEQLDQYWNYTDYSGSSEIPNVMLQQMAPLNITIDNTKVLISFDGVGQYGEPKLTFTIFSTDAITHPDNTVTAAGTILTWPAGTDDAGQPMVIRNYAEEGDKSLDSYALVDGDSYSTTRKSWTWDQDATNGYSVDVTDPNNIITTFNGTRSDDNSQTIVVVETKTLDENGIITGLSQHVTSSEDEDYTISIITTDENNPNYDSKGVELTYVGAKQYVGDLYQDVNVVKFINAYTDQASIEGTARSLDGSSVEIFKPEGQKSLEIMTIGRDGKQQKLTEDDADIVAEVSDEIIVEMRNDVSQWSYTDHNNVEWVVVDMYDGSTWSSVETSSAGERSHTDTWTETGGTSIFVEKLTGQETYTETRTFSSDYTNNTFKDIQTVVATSGNTQVSNYTETMTFNADYSSTRTVEGTLYEFNGEQFKDISVTETKDDSWQTTALSGTAFRAIDDASVDIGFDGVNSWGDPILTFAIEGEAVILDESEIANTNPIAADDTYTIDENETLTLNVLTNDTDADSDTLSIKSVGDAANGKVYLLDGNVVYSPDYNFSGTDKFTYTVTDGKGGSDTATVNITIDAVNEDAVAYDDNFVIEQGSLATVLDLTSNDTDGDGDALTVTAVSATTNGGTVSLDLGVVSYKAAAAFSGTDSFTYTLSDGIGETTTAIATITVEASNVAPTVVTDSVTLAEDNTVQIDVLANDSDDADTGNLKIASVGDASNGKVELMMGFVFYTPNADYSGADSFTYVAIDSEDATTTGTVNLTVNARNDAVVTVDDVVITEQDALALTIDVLSNDTDAEANTLVLLEVGDASHGVVAMVGGKVTYTPTADYAGADTFTYVVGDLAADGTTVQSKTVGTVNVTVSEANVVPIAVTDIKTVGEDSSNNKISVLTNDSDANQTDLLSLNSVGSALHGTTTVAGNDVMYTPDANYAGTDTFSYIVSDGKGGTTTGTVTVTVNNTNDAPVAYDDALGSVAVDQGPAKLDVLANDVDIDAGDVISIKSVGDSGATTATTTLGNQVSISQGKISYNANNAVNGSDSFNYTITDGDETATATATLTLSSNTNPDALNDQVIIIEDTATEIKVLDNDTDKDADRLSVLEVNIEPEHGSVSLTNGKVFYTPELNFVGSDSFTYVVKDGRGGRDEATVDIIVTAVNDAPGANVDQISVVADTSNNIIDVLSNDTDVDGDTLTVTDIGTGTTLKDGVVTLTNGVVSYSPKDDFTGPDSFTYTVSDGTATATATANISVTAANIAPVAANNTVVTAIVEDSRDNQIDLTASISDADGDTVSIAAVTQAEHGTVKLTAGKVFYTPDADYYGNDSFTYTIDDANGGQDSGVVTLSVSDVNDDAVAVNDDLGDIMIGARQVKVELLSNDTDADGDAIEVTGVSDAKYGTVKFADGSVFYTPGSSEGVDTFTYTITGGDEGIAKINAVAPNNTPEGEVKITGSVQAGQTLTVSNTLTDADTLGTIGYQWHKDGVEMLGQTATTYEITLEDVDSKFTVKASYTDARGTLETVSSETTAAVTALDTPFSFVSSVVSGIEASTALTGYTFADTDELVKLTLNVDLDSIYSRADITSITGAQLTLGIDWSQFDALDSVSTEKFAINQVGADLLALNSSSISDSNTFDTLGLASLRQDVPLLTIVDSDLTNDSTNIVKSANLIEVYVRPVDDAGKLSIDIGGIIEANQGQATFVQYDSTASNISGISGNSTSTGSVIVSGEVVVDGILTASHTLADADGIGVVSYQWLSDGAVIANATGETYTLTTNDINKDISVKASYTDGGNTVESVSSTAQTLTQSTLDKPLMFTSELITAQQASYEMFWADFSSDADETIVKLTLNADMARFADGGSISSIAGIDLDFDLDWSLFEDIAFTNGAIKYGFNEVYTAPVFMSEVTNSSGEITKLVAASLNLSTQPQLTLVDNIATTASGEVDQPSSVDLLTIYLNPKASTKDFEVIFGGNLTTDQGAGSDFTQLSHSLEVAAKTYDAIVSTDSTAATNDTAATVTKLTGDVIIDLWDSNATAAKSSIAIDSGEIAIENTVSFDEVRLSASDAYDFDINISDAIDVLRHIVNLETLAPGSNGFHAADVDNSGSVNISDAIDILRHIVNLDTIDTFDLIDSNGNRISQLDATAAGEPPTWTLVANGDVDSSGGFNDDYVVTVDIV